MEAARQGATAHLVMPCFNERSRLAVDEICSLISDERVSLVMVDDGSTDGTLELLRALERDAHDISVIALPANVGKGEAVRAGLTSALSAMPAWVGYVDADMSTPALEVLRLLDLAQATDRFDVVFGSRVAMLGRRVQRSPFRHYAGRVFATLASLVLDKAIYDTQCGAKLFRRTEALHHSTIPPFRSRWAFDVELLGRLHAAGVDPSRFWEEPLQVWRDADGSRRSVAASVRATASLLPIWRDLRAARR